MRAFIDPGVLIEVVVEVLFLIDKLAAINKLSFRHEAYFANFFIGSCLGSRYSSHLKTDQTIWR